jgi:hypothetical protein
MPASQQPDLSARGIQSERYTLNLPTKNEVVKETIELVRQNDKAEDGGIRLGPSSTQHSDVCVKGMLLNYASYFKTSEMKLHCIIDSILAVIMPDGGFNCRTTGLNKTESIINCNYNRIQNGICTDFNRSIRENSSEKQSNFQRK